MEVAALWRYPVKSLLGEQLEEAEVVESGLVGDRTHAVVTDGPLVASAKRPSRWGHLLQHRATVVDGRIVIDPPLDVSITDVRPEGAELERVDPDAFLASGAEEIDRGSVAAYAPGRSFVDFAPIHFLTTTSLGAADVERYRPNLVLHTPELEGMPENDWMGRRLHIGPVELQVLIPTPRCVIPMLAHGSLPPDRAAFPRHNRVEVPTLGAQPCLGAYAMVRAGGTIRVGDPVVLG